MNSMIVEFFWIWSEKYKINNWVQIIWVVYISSKNLIISFRQTNIQRVCDICKSITMDWIMRKKRILDIISNIKVTSHSKNIIDISFSILKILQSCLRKIWINVHQKLNWATIEKGNARNTPMCYGTLGH